MWWHYFGNIFRNRKWVDNQIYELCKLSCHKGTSKDEVTNYKEDIVVEKEEIIIKKEIENNKRVRVIKENEEKKQYTVWNFKILAIEVNNELKVKVDE